MPREKKLIQQEVYEDQGRGISVPIYYNPNRHNHCATVQRQTFEEIDIGKVRAWVRGQIADLYSVSWQAVIEVQYGLQANYSSELRERRALNFSYDRYWVGRLASGGLRKARWDDAWDRPIRWLADEPEQPSEDRRIDRSTGFWGHMDTEFAPPLKARRPYGNSPDAFYYPYSDDLWAGLARVRDEIDRIAKILDGMLAVEGDSYLAIAALAGGFLLPATVGEG